MRTLDSTWVYWEDLREAQEQKQHTSPKLLYQTHMPPVLSLKLNGAHSLGLCCPAHSAASMEVLSSRAMCQPAMAYNTQGRSMVSRTTSMSSWHFWKFGSSPKVCGLSLLEEGPKSDTHTASEDLEASQKLRLRFSERNIVAHTQLHQESGGFLSRFWPHTHRVKTQC